MADDDLTQAEANALIAMEKHAADEVVRDYPQPGRAITAPWYQRMAESTSFWTLRVARSG